MAEDKKGLLNYIFSAFEYVDEKYGPSKKDYKPACYETREMLMECVL